MQLIREISSKHIKRELSYAFGRHFKVNTRAIVPSEDYLRFNKDVILNESGNSNSTKGQREAFFYYLLIANIVLLFAVITLVFNAVVTVYYV